jgi:hypothetical protein
VITKTGETEVVPRGVTLPRTGVPEASESRTQGVTVLVTRSRPRTKDREVFGGVSGSEGVAPRGTATC